MEEYRSAASRGCVPAMVKLGYVLMTGSLAQEVDTDEGLRLYREAAGLGELGVLLLHTTLFSSRCVALHGLPAAVGFTGAAPSRCTSTKCFSVARLHATSRHSSELHPKSPGCRGSPTHDASE